MCKYLTKHQARLRKTSSSSTGNSQINSNAQLQLPLPAIAILWTFLHQYKDGFHIYYIMRLKEKCLFEYANNSRRKAFLSDLNTYFTEVSQRSAQTWKHVPLSSNYIEFSINAFQQHFHLQGAWMLHTHSIGVYTYIMCRLAHWRHQNIGQSLTKKCIRAVCQWKPSVEKGRWLCMGVSWKVTYVENDGFVNMKNVNYVMENDIRYVTLYFVPRSLMCIMRPCHANVSFDIRYATLELKIPR